MSKERPFTDALHDFDKVLAETGATTLSVENTLKQFDKVFGPPAKEEPGNGTSDK